MKSKIWIGNMSENDKALAFKAVQEIDEFYRNRSLSRSKYVGFFLNGADITNITDDQDKNFYDDDKESTEITLQQLLKLAGMEDNMTFTKSDLVAGKHVIECDNKDKYLVAIREDGQLFGINLNRDRFLPLNCHDNNLEYNSKDLSINAVYEMNIFNTFLDLARNLKLVWKREEKTETQIQFEKLMQQIADLQAQANKLQSTL